MPFFNRILLLSVIFLQNNFLLAASEELVSKVSKLSLASDSDNSQSKSARSVFVTASPLGGLGDISHAVKVANSLASSGFAVTVHIFSGTDYSYNLRANLDERVTLWEVLPEEKHVFDYIIRAPETDNLKKIPGNILAEMVYSVTEYDFSNSFRFEDCVKNLVNPEYTDNVVHVLTGFGETPSEDDECKEEDDENEESDDFWSDDEDPEISTGLLLLCESELDGIKGLNQTDCIQNLGLNSGEYYFGYANGGANHCHKIEANAVFIDSIVHSHPGKNHYEFVMPGNYSDDNIAELVKKIHKRLEQTEDAPTGIRVLDLVSHKTSLWSIAGSEAVFVSDKPEASKEKTIAIFVGRLTHPEFLTLLKHSHPIAMVTGDQSFSEAFSLNKRLVYQSFSHKNKFANRYEAACRKANIPSHVIRDCNSWDSKKGDQKLNFRNLDGRYDQKRAACLTNVRRELDYIKNLIKLL